MNHRRDAHGAVLLECTGRNGDDVTATVEQSLARGARIARRDGQRVHRSRFFLTRRFVRGREIVVRAIAEGRGAAVLAAAEHGFLILRRLELERLDAGTLVRPIAERLLLAAATRTPPIGAAGLELDEERTFLRDYRFSHDPESPRSRTEKHFVSKASRGNI
jgi:hypothetical protein